MICSRQMQLEFDTYRQTVEKVGEEAKKIVTADTGAVCEICHKTKFADGVGHKCAYCNLKSCARCGGRMAVKNKVIIMLFHQGSHRLERYLNILLLLLLFIQDCLEKSLKIKFALKST